MLCDALMVLNFRNKMFQSEVFQQCSLRNLKKKNTVKCIEIDSLNTFYKIIRPFLNFMQTSPHILCHVQRNNISENIIVITYNYRACLSNIIL